jgi:hypothetical protein
MRHQIGDETPGRWRLRCTLAGGNGVASTIFCNAGLHETSWPEGTSVEHAPPPETERQW